MFQDPPIVIAINLSRHSLKVAAATIYADWIWLMTRLMEDAVFTAVESHGYDANTYIHGAVIWDFHTLNLYGAPVMFDSCTSLCITKHDVK